MKFIKYVKYIIVCLALAVSASVYAQKTSISEVCYSVVSPLDVVYEAANQNEPITTFYQIIDEQIPASSDSGKFFNAFNKKYVLLTYANKDLPVDKLMKFLYNTCQIELAIITRKLV